MSIFCRTSLALVLFSVAACSDDDPASPNGGGGAGGDTTGSTTGSGTSTATTGGGGSGAGPQACGEGIGTAEVESGSWDPAFTIAGFSGHDGIAPTVHDFAVEPDGSVIAAGRFQWFEGEPVAPLMRWTGSAWEPARTTWELEAPLDGFSAVAVSAEGDLALATNDSFGERDGEIWIDDGTGLRSIGAFTGQVRSLAWFDGRLWVAGLYTLDDPAPAVSGLATWDGSTWSAPPGGELEGVAAFELTVEDGELLVGGSFTGVGGVAAANVASFDGADWSAFDFPDALVIYALARTEGGELYAGGGYGEFAAASGLARWDGDSWETVGGGLSLYQTRGVVTDIAIDGDVVDATGCFNTAGGLPDAPDAVPSRGVARWDGAAWQSLDDDLTGTVTPWFQPGACGDEGPTAIWDVTYQRLAHDGQQLFAGGWFSGVDGVLSQGIASHDGTTWLAQGSSGLGIGGSIDAIAAAGETCDIYGIGAFTHAAGEQAKGRVLHFTGTGWEALPDPLPSDAWCPAIEVSPAGEVAVGCMVFPPAGDAVGAVLRRDGDAMVEMELPGLGPVTDITWAPDGALWIAGAGLTGFVARAHNGELEIVEDGFDSIVNHIDVAADGTVVAAGAFTTIDGVPAARIARFDGTKWSALGDGLPGQVLALGRDEAGTVYASTYEEGNGAFLLGMFDGTTWQELATPASGLTPVEYFSFNAIRAIDGGLVVSGTAVLDDESGRGVLVFRDGVFSPLGGAGVGAMGVGNVAVTSDSIWVAGSIAQAGPEADKVSTIGVARWRLGR